VRMNAAAVRASSFEFTIEGVTDGGTCADCVDANGTYITGEITPNDRRWRVHL
jgi:hypothetical protein